MLKYLWKFLKYLKQWERYEPSSFWLCIIGLYISFSAGFGALFSESHSQSQVVIEQVRGGGREDLGSSTSSAYIPPGRTTPSQTNPGTQDKTIKSSPKDYESKPGIRLGAGGNGGGSGSGGSGNGPFSWEEDNLIPPEERWKSDPDYWADYKYNREDFKKKKKLEEEVCSISDQPQNAARTVTEKLDKSNAVKKLVKTALKDQDVLNEYTRIKKRLQEGINPVDIGKKSTPVASNKVLIKGDEGRYLVEVFENQVNVLGICARGNKKNVKSFENLMNGMYGVNLQY